jgi:catechol 2,3-dioxygenase-like lactoylglutathione lyase family enzyme
MFAKIKHVAIVTDNWEGLGRFYETVFKMRREGSEEGMAFRRGRQAVALSDGYVGLNFNLRKPGRPANLDHFGIEVDDIELVFARLHEKYPSIEWLKRPGGRPFAGLSTHDPAGNVFDLSQTGMENRGSVYSEKEWQQDRSIHHLTLRAVDPKALARFYLDVFEFRQEPSEDPNFYFTDGKVTLIIAPWKISDFKGTGIERPKLDHIGFKVESLAAVKKDVETLIDSGPLTSPRVIAADAEGEARLRLFSTCRYGKHQLADPDGTLVDLFE